MRIFPKCVTVCCWANTSKGVLCLLLSVAWLLELGTSAAVSMAEGIPALLAATGRGSWAIWNGHHSQGQTPAHGGCATFCGDVGTCSLPENVLFAMQAQPYHGLAPEGKELGSLVSVGGFLLADLTKSLQVHLKETSQSMMKNALKICWRDHSLNFN